MAKIPISRLNSAPEEYQANEFNQLIEDLQDIVKILNSTYPKDQNDERERQVWFLGGQMANIYKNAKVDLTATTATELYAVPSDSRAIIKSIYVSDDSGSGSTITVDLFNGPSASSSKFNLYKTLAVGNNATVQLIDEPLILMENEVLEVTAANANRLHVIASILEINRNDQ